MSTRLTPARGNTIKISLLVGGERDPQFTPLAAGLVALEISFLRFFVTNHVYAVAHRRPGGHVEPASASRFHYKRVSQPGRERFRGELDHPLPCLPLSGTRPVDLWLASAAKGGLLGIGGNVVCVSPWQGARCFRTPGRTVLLGLFLWTFVTSPLTAKRDYSARQLHGRTNHR